MCYGNGIGGHGHGSPFDTPWQDFSQAQGHFAQARQDRAEAQWNLRTETFPATFARWAKRVSSRPKGVGSRQRASASWVSDSGLDFPDFPSPDFPSPGVPAIDLTVEA